MTDDSLDYLVNPDAPADWFVKFPLKECADLFGLRKLIANIHEVFFGAATYP